MSDEFDPGWTGNPAWTHATPDLGEWIAAFVAAVGSLDDVTADHTAEVETRGGGSYSYDYADLGSVLSRVRPHLVEHGLVVTQSATHVGEAVEVWTTILHTSGQFVTFQPLRLPSTSAPQAIGSSITYARRYSLMSILGLATVDDDGALAQAAMQQRSAQRSGQRPAQRAPEREPDPPRAVASTPEQTEAHGLIAGLSRADSKLVRQAFLDEFGCRLSDLDESRHAEALAFVKDAIADLSGPPPDGAPEPDPEAEAAPIEPDPEQDDVESQLAAEFGAEPVDDPPAAESEATS